MDFTFDNLHQRLNLITDRKSISDFTFIEPVGIAILKSIEEDEGFHFTVTQSYVNTMLHREYNSEKNYIPVTVVKHGSIEENVEKIVHMLMKTPYVRKLSDLDRKDLKDYLYYMVGELLNNAMHHSLSSIGAVISGQIYPSLGKIQICVVDRGVGFLENLKSRYNVSTEVDAVKEALKKGVSAPPTNFYYSQAVSHAGYGLFALSQILKHTKGRLLIVSNNGYLMQNQDGSFTEKTLETNWKGSIVAFEFYEEEINLSKDEFFKSYIWESPEDSLDDLFI